MRQQRIERLGDQDKGGTWKGREEMREVRRVRKQKNSVMKEKVRRGR